MALTAAAYFPVWNNGFIDYDDEPYITTNPRVAEGLTPSAFWWAWTNDEAPYWTPLTWLSFQFDAQFFSARSPDGQVVLNPAAFHGQNLACHAASALLLFGLWRRLTGSAGRAFLVAALFAVHPMHVESVAWAIERKDVQMDLNFVHEALGKERPKRAVDQPRGEDLLGSRPAFALHEPAGEFSGGGAALAVIHLEREKVDAFAGVSADNRAEHNSVAILNGD